jgi:hypothetical protein
MMGGIPEGVGNLRSQFSKGFWTENRLQNKTLFETVDEFLTIVYGQLIAPAWKLSENVWPVIIIKDKADSKSNPEEYGYKKYKNNKRSIDSISNVTVASNSITALGEQVATTKPIDDKDAAAMRLH